MTNELISWIQNEIFISRGSESTILSIREVGHRLYPQDSYWSDIITSLKSLDTGDEFAFRPETSDVPIRLAFADTLLRFLNSLTEAVVPAAVHSRCRHAIDRDEAFEVMLSFI